MDDSKLRFGVGVLVIAAIGIGVILTFLFGAFPAILSREYHLTVYFPSAEGINTNSAVLRDGVKIGRVSDIQLLKEGGVALMLAISAEHRMTHEYIPRIGIGSLITGDSKLEFHKADPAELQRILKSQTDLISEYYTDGEVVDYGQKLQDPFSLVFGMEDELRKTFQSVRGAGDSVEQTGDSIKTLVRDFRSLIGAEPASGGTPPSYPPSSPNQSSINSNVHPASLAAFGGDGLPPGPAWARPVVLTAYTSGNAADGSLIQTVAFASPLPNQDQNQFAPPNPPSNAPQTLGIAPAGGQITLRDLQAEAIVTLKELQLAIRDARATLGDEQIRRDLRESIGRFPGLLDQTTETLRTTQKTFDSFADVGKQFEQVGSVAEQALNELKTTAGDTLESFQATAKNVEAITEPIGRRSEDLVVQVLRSLANVDSALMQLDTFGQTLNTSEGTVKRLLEDDELYFEIRRTVENIEAATARVRPILDDVRVFTDKISRDPRQLGVRGALGNRPTGAGLK